MYTESMVREALALAYSTLKLIDAYDDARQTVNLGSGFGDPVNDTEINADRQIGDALIGFLKRCAVSEIWAEGFSPVENPTYTNGLRVFIDPLDGSLNFLRSKGNIALPYTSVISVTRPVGSTLIFGNILASGVVDLRTNEVWYAEKGKGVAFSIYGQRVEANGRKVLDLGMGVVIGEFYYPENRRLLMDVFPEKGWLRNCGSAAYEMMLVASGVADAYVCDRQKNHELGAGYLAVTEAGGAALDFDGNDLGLTVYDFNAQTPVVLGATKEIALEIVERIKKARN